jgi:hypothetical protein
MGCDIHLYIEYKLKEDTDWVSFGKEMGPGRDYGVFAELAGVRRWTNHTTYIEPRGIPEKVGYSANDDYWLYIVDDASESHREGLTARSKAERWVKNGDSVHKPDNPEFISHPDWHSASWLTTEEYGAAIARVGPVTRLTYSAIYGTLLALTASGAYAARVVFWFDN